MLGIIAAVSPEGVIGKGGQIPWRHPGDLKRFMRVTLGSTVIMGRLTWVSMDRKPLPKRRNIVISSREPTAADGGADWFKSIPSALATCSGDVWFIGGARIYEEALKIADVLDLTYVPDPIDPAGAVRFPPIDPAVWTPGPELEHEIEPGLRRRVYTRRGGG